MMFRCSIGVLPSPVSALFHAILLFILKLLITIEVIYPHSYLIGVQHNTRSITPAANTSYVRLLANKFMHSKFCFVGIKVWNYITDDLGINMTLPKFKKIFKILIQTNDIKFPFMLV